MMSVWQVVTRRCRATNHHLLEARPDSLSLMILLPCVVESLDITFQCLTCPSLLHRSYELGPEEVIKFCTECVLSEEEGECDLPPGFYDKPRP